MSGTSDTSDTVTIVDTLPTEVTLVNATASNGFNCTQSNPVTCTGSGLAQGQTTVVDILTTVSDTVTTSFVNTATVSVVSSETITSNNGPVTVTTSVGGSGIDLQVLPIADTDNPDPVNIPGALSYTIVVQNNGTSTAGSVADPAQVRIDLPPNGISNPTASGDNGFNCSLSGSTFTCEGVFPGGGSTTITVNMSVVSGAPPDLTLVAIADPTNKYVESDEGNNSQTGVTTVSNAVCTASPCIDLVLAQALGSPNPVAVGATETFQVEIVNIGDTTTENGGTDNVFLTINVDNQFNGTPIVTPPSGFGCTGFGAGVFLCTGNLGAGEGKLFTITAEAGPSTGTIDISAQLTLIGALEPEFTTDNNGASYSTTVVP